MNVQLNEEQRLFVIESGSSVSCLGFDVVYAQACEMHRRLSAKGVADLPLPLPEGVGTTAQYEQYRELMNAYVALSDTKTWFDARTPKAVQRLLEQYRRSEQPVRVFYGDATGRDWLEEFETVGVIGRSTGAMKVPLLILEGEAGGGALLTHCIVRIIDVTTNKEVYRAANYYVPELTIQAAGADLVARGLAYTVMAKSRQGEFETEANFKTFAHAAHFVAFMSGMVQARPEE